MEKGCVRCGRTLPVEAFYRQAASKDGLHCWCKGCVREYCGERLHRRQQGPHVDVAEKGCQRCKKVKPAVEFYGNRANLDGLTDWCKQCEAQQDQEARKLYPEREHARDHRLFVAHPETYRAAGRRRRARLAQVQGEFTPSEFEELCEAIGYRCPSCRLEYPILTADHVVPLSEGGSNDISNIQPLCRSCNSSKGTRTMDFRVGFEAT